MIVGTESLVFESTVNREELTRIEQRIREKGGDLESPKNREEFRRSMARGSRALKFSGLVRPSESEDGILSYDEMMEKLEGLKSDEPGSGEKRH